MANRSSKIARYLLAESWPVWLFVAGWSSFIVVLYEFLHFSVIAIPIVPISMIGIAVTLYLGFKSRTAYARWWEGQTVWGDIVSQSRSWASHVLNMTKFDDEQEARTVHTRLIRRHMAWVHALSSQLHDSGVAQYSSANKPDASNADRIGFQKYLSPDETAELRDSPNPATAILLRQGLHIKELLDGGNLDAPRFVTTIHLLDQLHQSQASCERINNTPLPSQVAIFGKIFTWTFILLMPLAFIDEFAHEVKAHALDGYVGHEFMFVLVPFTTLIAWIFYVMQRISDSMQDPFESATGNASFTAHCRQIENELTNCIDDWPGWRSVEPDIQPTVDTD